MTTKHKIKLVVKQYEGAGKTDWGIFRAGDVRGAGDVVRYPHPAMPFRGYSGLTKQVADVTVERLQKELH